MSDVYGKNWHNLVFKILGKSPQTWRILLVAIASVIGSYLSFKIIIQSLQRWKLLQQYNAVQVSRIEDLPTNLDKLKAICLSKLQENQALIEQVRSRDRELSTQRQSLANLALTVVKQDRHIKALLKHMEAQNQKKKLILQKQKKKEDNQQQQQEDGGGNITESGLSGGLAQSSVLEDEDTFQDPQITATELFQDPQSIIGEADEEEDEVSQLKMQILEASDFLNDLANDGDNDQPSSVGTHYSSSISTSTMRANSRRRSATTAATYQRWPSAPPNSKSRTRVSQPLRVRSLADYHFKNDL
eukprot:TRINITY_DN16996_c0_g1_i1.p1 TRINITY_DN16996_c0_g1~~TRINITY_DN16996_c0_g1_i1.p1  ORF type:complete len:331 (+),score=43.55 TRINITY_DN16996_c0_g1_i1:93-995(+)